MSDNLVYEVTQMFSDRGNMQQDMSVAAKMAMGVFQDKYFKKMNDAIVHHQKATEQNPPREVQLMRAMKAFLPEDKHQGCERAIEMMLLMGTYESIQKDLGGQKNLRPQAKNVTVQNSIHPDGIYDVDESCVKNKQNPQSMMMAMMLGMGMMAK